MLEMLHLHLKSLLQLNLLLLKLSPRILQQLLLLRIENLTICPVDVFLKLAPQPGHVVVCLFHLLGKGGKFYFEFGQVFALGLLNKHSFPINDRLLTLLILIRHYYALILSFYQYSAGLFVSFEGIFVVF